jgi:hypothetical protein
MLMTRPIPKARAADALAALIGAGANNEWTVADLAFAAPVLERETFKLKAPTGCTK